MKDLISGARFRLTGMAYRWQFRLANQPRALDMQRLQTSETRSPNVLFLCYGNICRSPLAERYLRSELDGRSIEDVSIDSAGLRTEAGRTSPSNAVTAAETFGVDLEDHRSKPITRERLEWSDIVFIKDMYNYILLRREFDGWEDKTYFLGALTDDDSYEITDPYGSDVEGFKKLYGDVVTGVDQFVKVLETGQNGGPE